MRTVGEAGKEPAAGGRGAEAAVVVVAAAALRGSGTRPTPTQRE